MNISLPFEINLYRNSIIDDDVNWDECFTHVCHLKCTVKWSRCAHLFLLFFFIFYFHSMFWTNRFSFMNVSSNSFGIYTWIVYALISITSCFIHLIIIIISISDNKKYKKKIQNNLMLLQEKEIFNSMWYELRHFFILCSFSISHCIWDTCW